MPKPVRAVLVCLAALLMPVPATHAAIEQGLWFLALFGGEYRPQPDLLDDDTTIGVQFGHALTRHLAITGTMGKFSADEQFSGTLTGSISLDLIFVETGVRYTFLPGKRFSPSLAAGIGGAFFSTDGGVSGPGGPIDLANLGQDSLTVNFGVGTNIRLNEKIYLRLASKWRWFESRDDDEIDTESFLGIGFVWGR